MSIYSLSPTRKISPSWSTRNHPGRRRRVSSTWRADRGDCGAWRSAVSLRRLWRSSSPGPVSQQGHSTSRSRGGWTWQGIEVSAWHVASPCVVRPRLRPLPGTTGRKFVAVRQSVAFHRVQPAYKSLYTVRKDSRTLIAPPHTMEGSLSVDVVCLSVVNHTKWTRQLYQCNEMWKKVYLQSAVSGNVTLRATLL